MLGSKRSTVDPVGSIVFDLEFVFDIVAHVKGFQGSVTLIQPRRKIHISHNSLCMEPLIYGFHFVDECGQIRRQQSSLFDKRGAVGAARTTNRGDYLSLC